jgi:hypothetical protein
MRRTTVTRAVALPLPFVVSVSGARVMAKLSHRELVVEQLRVSAAANKLRLRQLRLFADDGSGILNRQSVQMASAATILKLVFFAG